MESMKNYAVALVVGLAVLQSNASAALFETRSNYLGPDWSADFLVEANWAGLTPYSTDAGDPISGHDIDQVTMGHDDNNLYIKLDQALAQPYDPGNQFIFFDTDQNAGTGYTSDPWWWGQSSGGVGAEYVMYGAFIRRFSDNSISSSVPAWYNGASPTTDIYITIPRSDLGSPSSFTWAGRASAGNDFYPSFASNGDWNLYDLTVPEPTGIVLAGLALGSTLLVRRRKG